MAFKEKKGNKAVEVFVTPAPGDMFKGYIRITAKLGHHTIHQTVGRGCGRPLPTASAAMELAETEAKRVISL
jgi:hypothetical protein